MKKTVNWSVALIFQYFYCTKICLKRSLLPGLGVRACFRLFQYFQELQRNVIAMQPLEKQEDMAQCFRNLMEGVEPSLITKNRDR